jgi:MYXO-CTERM domain-containing protein
MLNKMLIKKISVGLIACAASLFSVLSQGAIISSFDTEVNVEVSSTFENAEFETILCCNEVYEEGSASGSASGTGDGGPVTLGAGDIGVLNAVANGQVTGLGGYVDSAWASVAYLLIENNTSLDITGDVSFDIFLSANIFNDRPYSEAYSGAYLYIENFAFDVIFDDYIEFDSFFDGTGELGTQDSFTIKVDNLTIGAGDFERYYIQIAAEGFADVPEPGGVLLAGLALLFALRKRKMS